ncbi:MAG: hypothetical protein AAF224_02305 [Pseudomonadota bacterium]
MIDKRADLENDAPASDATPMGSPADDLGGKSVRELQNLLDETAASVEPRRPSKFSRAAELHLIDRLSRKSAAALGLLAGVAVFAAVLFGRTLPTRAAVWAIIVFAALYACQKIRRGYRTGAGGAARPFRWRADYAASLAVLSAAIGAGSVLLSPDGHPGAASAQLIPLLAAGLALAAALSAADRISAISLLAPGMFFILPSAINTFGLSLLSVAIVVTVCAGAATALLSSNRIAQETLKRFPRTQRRLVEDAIAPLKTDADANTLAPSAAATRA